MLFHKKERAQGMVEYALIIVLIALVVIFMVTVMGGAVSSLYSTIRANWPGG
jgi:pilus assembly protein Flp/PilA